MRKIVVAKTLDDGIYEILHITLMNRTMCVVNKNGVAYENE
ncbi:MAG: hypothetical protein WC340_04770 [Kiritimatiellia bacterium]